MEKLVTWFNRKGAELLIALAIIAVIGGLAYAGVYTLGTKTVINVNPGIQQYRQGATFVTTINDVFASQLITPYKSVLISVTNGNSTTALDNLDILVSDQYPAAWTGAFNLVDQAAAIGDSYWTDCTTTLAASGTCYAEIYENKWLYTKVMAACTNEATINVRMTGRKIGY